MLSAGFVALAETARLEKHVKNKLAVAADHFNRDYKKGFQFLQVNASCLSQLRDRRHAQGCCGGCSLMLTQVTNLSGCISWPGRAACHALVHQPGHQGVQLHLQHRLEHNSPAAADPEAAARGA